ncbi:MAG: Fe-S cluster assembly protein SufB [Acidaminococcus sp.]|jgi:Fe-S cluster assembly protein SufB|nr:Fe-S cluster assembly protein SufB [Acidaminococcus sp.]MCI2099922.1 Fe-S cluster assembly protein SufB [Acidaminococcus sp.]MCI2114153.1 Fe-S cluster assembly protein SufB [Acidaminococcus sp.]MCI2116363.1 Fe-S cluster assembly protein SufB [Acidaminococcus sp.]
MTMTEDMKAKERKLKTEQVIDSLDDLHNMYDFRNDFKYSYRTDAGLTPDIVREISAKKDEPKWMLDFRLKSLDIFNKMPYPEWGPDISGLDMDNIITYVRPNTQMRASWDEVPDDIKNTFDRLGIPEAEKKSLAGVGAQYDSEVVYHSIQEDLVKQGVIYTDFDTALKQYEDVVRSHFMKLVPPTDHKFAALHGAVWSGGSFVYVPEGVDVSIPLQSYFRLNAPGAGQFEHTLIIVEKGAKVHFIEGCSAPKYNVANLHAGCVELFVGDDATLTYSTIENWSKNMYNLNTKRALVGKNGTINWVTGSFGSHTSCLYPMSILNGEGAHCEFTGVTFAGKGQYLDTGSKVVHNAPNTTSNINSKSISKDGGVCIYRGSVVISEKAEGSKATVSCESLMLDEQSQSDTIPAIIIKNDNVDLGHEAKIGRISDEAIFYLMSRGLSEDEARAMLVRGFVDPVSKALPLEYAVEMNNLINLELKGSI